MLAGGCREQWYRQKAEADFLARDTWPPRVPRSPSRWVLVSTLAGSDVNSESVWQKAEAPF